MYQPDDGTHRLTDPEPARGVIAYARRLINSCMWGDLILHYDTRTITLTNVNGDAAMRITNLIASHDPDDPSSKRWSEHCDPTTADSTDRWTNFDAARVLSSDWHPARMVVADPDRKTVQAAFRLLDSNADEADYANWDDDTRVNYSTVLLHQQRAASTRLGTPDPAPTHSAEPKDAAPATGHTDESTDAPEGEAE